MSPKNRITNVEVTVAQLFSKAATLIGLYID